MKNGVHTYIIGQIFVDVTLPAKNRAIKLRAGGIMHAARALWALERPYSLLYCAPDYLEAGIANHVQEYEAQEAVRLGAVTGSPNVMLIGEPKECGPQGYEHLLRDHYQCKLDIEAIARAIPSDKECDVIIFPGEWKLDPLLQMLARTKAAVHIDANLEKYPFADFAKLGRPIDTLIFSTSSDVFLDHYKGNPKALCQDLLGKNCRNLLLKENRGGSRLFFSDSSVILTPAQPRKVQHSVGVGDCFDAVYTSLRRQTSDQAALSMASCIAAEYASTTYPDVFKDAVQAWLTVPDNEIISISGTSLPWELRSSVNVYIAAPDFSYVDREPINQVVECLRYHNFNPRLPVREHGQMEPDANPVRRQTLCEADLRLLNDCQIMLAVMLYDDPGTLIEIGIAVERGVPVLVYDPLNRAENLMLTQLPQIVSSDLDEVITSLFQSAARVVQK